MSQGEGLAVPTGEDSPSVGSDDGVHCSATDIVDIFVLSQTLSFLGIGRAEFLHPQWLIHVFAMTVSQLAPEIQTPGIDLIG